MVGEEEVVHEETVIVGTSSRGNPKTKNKKKTVVNWMSRETKVCVDDAEQLRKDVITSLSGRINECIHPVMGPLFTTHCGKNRYHWFVELLDTATLSVSPTVVRDGCHTFPLPSPFTLLDPDQRWRKTPLIKSL